MRITISKQLWFLTGLFVVAILSSGLFSYFKAKHFAQVVIEVGVPAVRTQMNIDMMHDGIRAAIMDAVYASTTDEKLLAEISDELKEKSNSMLENLAFLQGLALPDNIKQATLSTKQELDAYLQSADAVMKSLEKKDSVLLGQQILFFRTKFSELEKKLEIFGDLIQGYSSELRAESEQSLMLSLMALLLITVVGALSLVWVRKYMISMMIQLSGRLQTMALQVSQTSDHLNLEADNLQNSVSTSASSLEETTASLSEISSMAQSTSQHSLDAFSKSKLNQSIAEQGILEIKKLGEAVQTLSAKSAQIQEIVTVIDDIAFQTNLLALNASVEAARAGEQGKGFAVVAEAVRSLAQKCASAAQDISKMISESSETTTSAVLQLKQNEQKLNEIFNSASGITQINQSLQEASKQQTVGVEEIFKALQSLDSQVQVNANSSKELLESSEVLKSGSNEMSQAVREFQDVII